METESHGVCGCLLWTNSRPLRCLETSEGPLLFVFMVVWGFLQQFSTRWKLCFLCGISSLINAIPWDIYVGIWGPLWKLISVTVLIPPGRSLTHSVRQICRQSFQTMSAPSLQAVAFLSEKQNIPIALSIYLFMLLGPSLWACHQADWIHGVMEAMVLFHSPSFTCQGITQV